MIITIDGPSASGKSTAALQLAHDLKFLYLNTGLLYRAYAYALVTEYGYSENILHNPDPRHIQAILQSEKVEYSFGSHGAAICFDGLPITALLKKAPYDQWASIVSKNPAVRKALLDVQRDIGNKGNTVIEGRDCGTVIFPNAENKFFITASLDIRALRWHEYQLERGIPLSLGQAKAALLERDERDSNREIAPLKIPQNAIIIDSSNLTPEQVLSTLKNHIKVTA